jgi:hypothetical protein
MPEPSMNISENSNVAIPLRNLISLLVAVASAVWGYSVLESRITNLETRALTSEDDILRLEQANRDAATGIDPWATDVQQTTRLDRLEKDVQRIEALYLQAAQSCQEVR